MKPLLLFTGPPATRSGYGAHARDLLHSLIEMDRFDIKINSMRWGNTPMNALNNQNPKDKLIIDRIITGNQLPRQPEIHIQLSVPNEFTPLAKYNIGITAGIECTLPKPEWIDGLNRMNMNIVPSNFTKQVFTGVNYDRIDDKTKQKVGELKLEKPMEVLFEGVDTNIYKKTKEFSEEFVEQMNQIEEKFCFLYVGHWLQGDLGQDRKDTGMLVKTFLEKFKNMKNPPALIMKTSHSSFSVIDRRGILKKINDIRQSVEAKSYPNIYVLHGDLDDEEMNELYNHPKVKVHISFTKGEGFGRPLLEASLSEKPIMVSNWSGQLDFLNKNNAILLPGTLTDVHPSALPEEMRVDKAQWFTINYQYAAQMMFKVFKEYRNHTMAARRLAMGNKIFSLDMMTSKFSNILDKYLPNFEEQPQAVDLKLPKLKKVGDDKKLPKIKLPKLKRAE